MNFLERGVGWKRRVLKKMEDRFFLIPPHAGRQVGTQKPSSGFPASCFPQTSRLPQTWDFCSWKAWLPPAHPLTCWGLPRGQWFRLSCVHCRDGGEEGRKRGKASFASLLSFLLEALCHHSQAWERVLKHCVPLTIHRWTHP